jgi:polysaccharide biosynthesis protein PslH
MRIAYLCHRIPYPPNKGEKIRAYHQIRTLASRHEVDLFTLADTAEDMAHRDELERWCRDVTVVRVRPRLAKLVALPFLLTQRPLSLSYFYSREVASALRRAFEQRSYDRIFVYCSVMAQYVEHVDNIAIVTDMVDVDSDKWNQYADHTGMPMSMIYRREGRCLREYERRVCDLSAAVMVTTGREADVLKRIAPDANAHTLPIGVDTAYFSREAIPSRAATPTLVFTGDMAYFPNQHAVLNFTREVLPRVRRVIADTRFLIVGRNPPPAVKALHGRNGVEVTGYVPDVRTYLSNAHVAVAPFLIAAGIQNKVLEAMSYELPVVATSRPAQALSPRTASAIRIADSAEAMAAAIIELLRDPRLAREVGAESRAVVREDYCWERINNQLLALITDPIQRQPRTVAAGVLPAN